MKAIMYSNKMKTICLIFVISRFSRMALKNVAFFNNITINYNKSLI